MRVIVSLEDNKILQQVVFTTQVDNNLKILQTASLPPALQWQGCFMIALVMCSKHWHGFLPTASSTSTEYSSIFAKKMRSKNLLINTPETDNSGAIY